MSVFRRFYYWLPRLIRNILGPILTSIPFTFRCQQKRWIKDKYARFGLDQKRHIFMSIARFCNINRPMTGYYFEFGCHSAGTMRMAFDHSRYLFDWDYVAFDSFEGLPEIPDIDKQEIWVKGKLKTTEEEFWGIVVGHGMPPGKLKTVKGFYDKTLTKELKASLLPKKAVVVYIDCDLYSSTVPILPFIKDFLQVGTIIVFDDWYSFYGGPNRGERRAFREFREKNPELMFEEFVHTNEQGSFIFLGKKEAP